MESGYRLEIKIKPYSADKLYSQAYLFGFLLVTTALVFAGTQKFLLLATVDVAIISSSPHKLFGKHYC